MEEEINHRGRGQARWAFGLGDLEVTEYIAHIRRGSLEREDGASVHPPLVPRARLIFPRMRTQVINPRRACAARVTVVILSVCLSVCYHVFCRYAQQDDQYAILTGSVPHWLYFLNSVFRKNAGFESYGVKQSEGANMQISTGLYTSISSAYLGGIRSCHAGRVSTPACYLVV